MHRREFTARLAMTAVAASGVVNAQPVRRVYRIGVLGLGTTVDMAGPQPSWPSVKALLGGMRDLGYVYGEQFVTEARGAAGNPDSFPALAAELVRLKPDVILAGGGPSVPALKQATATIPIVMAASGDPVGDGYVQSLAHPGGNITGLSLQATETIAKRLELLKELVPSPGPIAVLWNAPTNQALLKLLRGNGDGKLCRSKFEMLPPLPRPSRQRGMAARMLHWCLLPGCSLPEPSG